MTHDELVKECSEINQEHRGDLEAKKGTLKALFGTEIEG